MGANLITQTCEYLKSALEESCGEKALMGIVSNLNTQKLTRVELILERVEEKLAQQIEMASLVAQCDPYRAVTHNKGIMNGMDGLCVATGKIGVLWKRDYMVLPPTEELTWGFQRGREKDPALGGFSKVPSLWGE